MSSSDVPSDLLDQPVERAVRLVALTLLSDAGTTRARLIDPSDTEALHDFRVAVRRLRSWLRAYRPYLDGSVRGKDRRRLRAVARATSVARDTEVHLQWLHDQETILDAEQRVGLLFLRRELEVRKHDADAELRSEVGRDFSRASEALASALPYYTLRGRVDVPVRIKTMAEATANLVTTGARTLRDRLAQVRTVADQSIAHEARIEAKRLRYLLEPIESLVSAAHDAIARLKELQDLIGDMHDATVLIDELVADAEATDPTDLSRPGLVALVTQLRAREMTAFDRLDDAWLNDRAYAFFESVTGIAAHLAARARAGIETERKYLLRALPEHVLAWPHHEIEQGYLPGDRLAERLRRVRADGAERWYRTVKAGSGVTRTELEDETTQQVFDTMWPLTEGHRVHKRRYAVADETHVWEIDEFTDRDLVLAEVELSDPDAPIEPPTWLAPYVVREVTGESEFLNLNLAG
ncbi:MAG TPA: CHAD domain-containing protein [Gemmatimonadaceae bacterium]|nr:CHAD domain-containing protein [Gemmatimonadaceae bacterium]